MFYSKKLKKFKNINHCFFLEKGDFQKVYTKVLIVEKDQRGQEKMSIRT